MTMRAILALACAFALNASAAPSPDYESLKAGAEKLFADGSFAKANDLYRQANLTNLPPAEQCEPTAVFTE